MNTVEHRIDELTPPRFVGGPVERATAVVEHFADRIPEKIEDDADAILADPDARRWIQACIDAAAELPEELTYLEGTAKALRRSLDSVFAGHHRAFFPPEESPRSNRCRPTTTVARCRRPGGCLRRHQHQRLLCREYPHRRASAGPRIHRTMLMVALLARCDTVDEALTIVGRVRHLGGTITMADASGAVATVELDPSIHIERPGNRPWVAHTNHVCARPPLVTENPDGRPLPVGSRQGRLDELVPDAPRHLLSRCPHRLGGVRRCVVRLRPAWLYIVLDV